MSIARVERKNYRMLAKGIGADATVSARMATVNAILKYIRTGEWWIYVPPGLAIASTVLGFNLLGDGLRKALDPRAR